MKKIHLSLLLLMTTGQLKVLAQLTGDSIVCSGFIYSYSASIPGAVTYNWSTPAGWYDLVGQGSASISVTCNVTIGNICVEGFDANANSLGTFCLGTSFGGGALGWDLLPNPISGCLDPPFSFIPTIQPNGTGGGACPPGCGNGTLHPNLVYGLYNQPWPSGTLISIIDGVSPISSGGLGTATLYAYFVDITNGMNPPNAILIAGGCGSATVNNTTNITYIDPVWPMLGGGGGNCIGDTVMITEGTGAAFNFWDFEWGCTLISGQFSYPAYVVIDSAYCELYFDGTDVNGCHTYGVWQQYFQPCVPAVAGFASADTFLCPGTCADFGDQTVNAYSLQWLFPGGNPSSSSAYSPQNICYSTPGSYDVTQIAYSPYGNDTLTLTNYITVFPFPPPQSIVQSGDTLFSDPVFASYQWYYNGNLINGATDYFYVAQTSGDYNVVATDANGCEVEAAVFNVVAGLTPALSKGEGVMVFPNPVLDKFTIQIPIEEQPIRFQFTIFSVRWYWLFLPSPLSEATRLEERAGVRSMFINFPPACTTLN
jgi:PKD repeat protein